MFFLVGGVNGYFICINVIDSGIGIKKDHIGHLLTAFQQADTSITRKFGGTGLGLSISNRLVKMMAGSFSIYSEFGQGSTFSFTLELPYSEKELVITEQLVNSLDEDASPLKGASILLVEDNSINQLVAQTILEHYHIEVDVADDGIQAISKVVEKSYDLVLMDIQMPKMDGLKSTKSIREYPDLKDLPIIAMTAHAMQEDKERCLAVGMNDYLSKPIDEYKLVQTLLKYIDSKKNIINTPERPVDSSSETLKPIEGFDIENGLKRLHNKEALYRRLLLQFKGELFKSLAAWNIAVELEDNESLFKISHHLKGVSANLCATDIETISTRINDQLRKGVIVEKEDIDKFREILNKSITLLESYLK